MKKTLLSLALLLATFTTVRSQSGDFVFWLPSTNTSSKDAQIIKNKQYVTVSLFFTEVYFKTGFLDKLKTIIISAGASHNFSGQKSDPSEQIIHVQAKKTGDGQSIGAQKVAITSLIPVSGDALSLHVTIKGTGEDRFKKLFELIGNADVQTALNLTDATVAKAGAVTNIVKGLLANPYTSDNPADILTFSGDFNFFENNSVDRQTSLREGYIVIVSGQKSDQDTFNKLRTLVPADMNKNKDVFEVTPGGLFHKTSGKLVDKVSYVILAVDQARELGENSNAAWFKKYNEALTKVKGATATTLTNAMNEANDLWREGTALLQEDKTYLAAEKSSLRDVYKTQIAGDATQKPGGSTLHSLAATKNLLVLQSMTSDQIAESASFSKIGTGLSGSLIIEVPDSTDLVDVTVTNKADPTDVKKLTITSGLHETRVKNLVPGEYLIEVHQANKGFRNERVVVGPKSLERVRVPLID